MPVEDTATLLISARADTTGVQKYITAVEKAEKSSNHLMKTLGNLFSAAAMTRWANQSVNLYARQEAAVESLRSSFRRLGAESDSATRDLMKFNKQMQATTIYGDEMLAMVESQGLNMGITTGKIKEATKAAIGLAAAYNMQLSTSMMLIARASQGQTQMLSRYGIVLGENLTPQEKYAKLLEFGAKGMSLAEDKTKTLTGALAQMSNAYGDAREKVGAQFAPAVSGIANAIKSTSEAFSNLSPEWQRFIVLTGTLTTGMVALKGVMGINTAVQQISAAVGVAASEKRRAAVAGEVQMEKALQKEKLATIALDQAKANVAMGRANLEAAQSAQAKALRGPDLDAIAAADAKVAEAQTALTGYEKALAKAEEAHLKASNAAAVFGASMQKNEDLAVRRVELVNQVNAAETESTKIALSLKNADEQLAAAELRLAEARRAKAETSEWYKNDVIAGRDASESGEEYRAQSVNFNKAQKDVDAARKAVKDYETQLESANAAVQKANLSLKDFDKAREKEAKFTASLKQNVAANEARAKVLKQTGDHWKAHEAATAAYNKVLAEQNAELEMNAAMERIRAQALQQGATAEQADAAAMAYRNTQLALAAKNSSLLGRAQLAMARSMKTAAAAAKGLVATLGPMLLISGGIAAVDMLLNSGRNKANARAANAKELADEQYAKFQSRAEARQGDKADLDKLMRMSSWQNKTAEEQKTMVHLLEKLNKGYNGLNLSLDENGNIVGDMANAYKVLNEQQRREKERENVVNEKNAWNVVDETANALYANVTSFVTGAQNGLSSILSWVSGNGFGANQVLDTAVRDMFEKEGGYGLEDVKDLVAMSRELGATGELVEKLKALQAAMEKAEKSAEYREKFARGETEEQKKQLALLTEAERKQKELTKNKERDRLYELGTNALKAEINRKRYLEFADKLDRLEGSDTETIKKRGEIERKMRDLQIDNLNLNRGAIIDSMKEQLSVLNKQAEFTTKRNEKEELNRKRLSIYEKTIAKYEDAMSNSENRQDPRIDAANRLMELTKERGALEEQIARDRYEEAKRYEEQEEAFFTNLYNMNARFRETTQNAISANSEQAIRLQSRSFGNETSGLQAAARGAKEAAEKTASLVDQLKEIQEEVQNKINDIRDHILQIGTSTAGGAGR